MATTFRCIDISGDILIYNFHFLFSDLSLLQNMLSFLLFLYFLNNNKEMIQLSLFQVIMFRQKYLVKKIHQINNLLIIHDLYPVTLIFSVIKS